MIADLTEYVRLLGPGGEPPDAAAYDAALELLRAEVVRQMARRGLWNAPPRFLGIFGGGRFWSEDLLDELVLDGYVELFLQRLQGFKNQLLTRTDVNGVITRSVRNFLHDRQKANDPLGYKLYEILSTSLGRLNDRAALRIEGGTESGKINNATLIVFGSRPLPNPIPEADLSSWVRASNDELWPDLITARGPGRRRVLGRLDAGLAALPDQGFAVLRFKDLIEPMKRDVRRRWHAELADLAELMAKSGDPPAELDFRKLQDCVAGKLEQEPAGVREDLRQLWLFLWTYATGLNPSAVAVKADKAGRPPADLGLERELGITRYRLPGLRKSLGRLIRECRSPAVQGKAAVRRTIEKDPPCLPLPAARPAGADGHVGAAAMSPTSRCKELRVATGEAAARWADRRAEIEREPRPPRPGDTFVLATSGDLLVEWLILEQDPENGRLLIVPADDRPEVGSRDVAVGLEMASVASVRCAAAGWLAAEAFDAKLRTGTLEPDIVDRVRQKRASIEARSCVGSRREQEVDDDSGYQGRMEELARMGTVLFTASSEPAAKVMPFRPRSRRATSSGRPRSDPGKRLFAIAATILLVAGLGGGMIWQRWQLISLERTLKGAAHPNLPVAWLTAEERVRGEDDPLIVPSEARRLALILEVTAPEIYPRYRVEISTVERREEIWTSDELIKSGSEVSFDLPRPLLTTGGYQLRLFGLPGADLEQRLLERYSLWVQLE